MFCAAFVTFNAKTSFVHKWVAESGSAGCRPIKRPQSTQTASTRVHISVLQLDLLGRWTSARQAKNGRAHCKQTARRHKHPSNLRRPVTVTNTTFLKGRLRPIMRPDSWRSITLIGMQSSAIFHFCSSWKPPRPELGLESNYFREMIHAKNVSPQKESQQCAGETSSG